MTKPRAKRPRNFHVSRKQLIIVGMCAFIVLAGSGGLVWHASSQLYAEQAADASGTITGVDRVTTSNTQAAQGEPDQTKKTTTQQAQSSATPPSPQTSATSTVPSASSSQSAPSSPSTVTTNSNLRGLSLYVDPSRARLPSPLNTSPTTAWFGDWTSNIQSATNSLVTAAAAQGSIATLVAYNIPGRDCGSYSSGGAGGSDAYKSWIRSFAAGIGQRQAIVVLEPDALAQVTCLDSAGQASRYALLQDAVSVLSSQTKAFIYLDAGNSSWIDASDMAARLNKVGLGNITGFSLNVSNFETTANSTAYGNTVSGKVGGKHFIIDTSRNGNGPGDTWCNPTGRALGSAPTVSTSGNVDAYLWIKTPGESDGTCNGGPSAGTYWPQYAQSLITNRH